MATKVWLANPETAFENIVEGVANSVVESSFVVAVKINLATNLVNDNGTTRAIQKKEAIASLLGIITRLEKDDGSDFG